uniref:Uncharacterized protein n=1 Tax=Pyxicephalus adspersus TaxID=30357 RepID=A0AAV3AYF8_PYXAD|nr:TPA: hypothetical protein GDO54_008281 [Pyxicephalus adspersus]
MLYSDRSRCCKAIHFSGSVLQECFSSLWWLPTVLMFQISLQQCYPYRYQCMSNHLLDCSKFLNKGHCDQNQFLYSKQLFLNNESPNYKILEVSERYDSERLLNV